MVIYYAAQDDGRGRPVEAERGDYNIWVWDSGRTDERNHKMKSINQSIKTETETETILSCKLC